MAGLDPAIHVFILAPFSYKKDVDARVKPVHDKIDSMKFVSSHR